MARGETDRGERGEEQRREGEETERLRREGGEREFFPRSCVPVELLLVVTEKERASEGVCAV